MTHRLGFGPWSLVLFACALAGGVARAATETAPARQAPEPKLLASITPEPGHLIEFRELASGALSVIETAEVSHAPLLDSSVAGKSVTEIYRKLRPKEQVPAALAEAQKRLAARKPAPAAGKPPAEEPSGAGKGPKALNAGEQAWFKKTFCNDVYGSLSLVNCIQGYEWVHSGTHESAIFQSQSLVGSEGVTATLDSFWWNGSAWTLLISYKVKPGTYYFGYVTDSTPFYWYVNLDGAGRNTMVSQDVKSCGNGGQWACTLNCQGTISCNPQNSVDCNILGAGGQSRCIANP